MRDPEAGSAVIEALQEKLKCEVDGIAGVETITALQWHLRGKGYDITCDGYFGLHTGIALQDALKAGTLWS